MPKQLWLMRHGQAEDPDTAGSDEERALSEIGRRQVSATASWLREHAPVPTAIWHSPLRRTQETAQTVADGLGNIVTPEPQLVLAPGMYAAQLFAAVAASSAEIVLCVGHQPDIGAAIQDAIGGGRFGVPPGTIAALDFPSSVAPGSAALRWLVDPRWFGG